ncbi:hypothetical protein ACFL43_06030 [Thermodesulfobacteriota bacterium]
MEIQASQMSSLAVNTSAASQKEQLGAQLINKTISKMNEKPSGSVQSDYQFQKDVLSAAAPGMGADASGAADKGTIINIIA